MKHCTYYDPDYHYYIWRRRISRSVLLKNWNDTKFIFRKNHNEDELDFSCELFNKVTGIFYEDFDLNYIFQREDNHKLYTCKAKDAYSNKLIDLIHDYYRLNFDNETRYFCECTMIYELRNIYNKFKNMIDEAITLDSFLNLGMTCKEKNMEQLSLIEVNYDLIDTSNKLIVTSDNVLSIEVEVDKKKKE